MATVTCTQSCYFYINGKLESTAKYTKRLTAGLTFTPSHPNHMPDYDDSVYTEYVITYNGKDYTTGSLTCPSSNFTVTYKFYGHTSSSWKLGSTVDYLNLKSAISHSLSFGTAGYVARIKVSFAYSGTATFSSSGDSDTIGYLSTVSTLDTSTGNPTSYIADNDDGGSDSNFSFTYDVTAGTTYYLWVRLYSIGDTGTTVAQIAPPTPVTPWDWNASNGKASASVTRAAHTAITSKGATSSFSYLVWNDLVNKVLEALSADGDSWSTHNSTYLDSDSTKMSPSDKTLTAARFNALRWNIGRHYSTGLTDKSKGDVVYGSYFTTLTSALNSWIATIT